MTSSSLLGKKILVPRGKNNSRSFSEIVEKFGAIPVEIPLLDFRPTQADTVIKRIVKELHTYDWLIFTSDAAVEHFFSFLNDQIPPSLPRIAVIGEKTKEVLLQKGINVHFQPKEYVAEGFVTEFISVVKTGEKVLVPKGNLAREYIARKLSEQGVAVDEIVIYETFFPEESREKLVHCLKEGSIDILPFTSPSTIEHFMSVVEAFDFYHLIENCIIAVIGPVSKKKCVEMGLKVDVMPKVYTSNEMIKAVAEYVEANENTGGCCI